MAAREQESGDTKDDRNAKLAFKALLSAVEGTDDCKPLLRLFSLLKQEKRDNPLGSNMTPKQQQALLLETIGNFRKTQANRFFSGLKSTLEFIIAGEAYVPESAFQEDQEDGNTDEGEITPDEKSTECLQFLNCAAMCVDAFLEGRIKQTQDRRQLTGMPLSMLPQVYDVAVDLHNILFSLHSCGPEGAPAEDSILKICETWWLANGVHRESLIAQCLPLLVLKALDDTEFQNSHIKRLFKMKEAFHVIDFSNPSSDALRSLLLRVASNPLCLRLPEGKKFLACLLLDPDLVSDLHLAFRAQIPQAKKTILQAYGEIYHRAWKDAIDDDSEEVQEAIEHKTLQDLMHASVHVSTPSTLKSVLAVLEPIYTDKKSQKTAELLYRLYNPILWRSLAATNPLVRKNAVVVLEKVFPLHDPSANQTKDAVEKAVAALKSALQDKDPRVRTAGAEATASICTVFWEALPATEIRTLLNHIVMGHASDASSSAVRVSALEAVTKLLEAPQSHAVLRALLPSLGNLIHDKVERVRLAAVRMLLKIKETRGIRFYHVVPVDHLTARLSEESRLHDNPRNPIAKELTALMLNSYFPQGPNVSGADQLKRSLAFFVTDPSAAVVFYANLVDLLDIEPVVKFIVMLLTCLRSAVDFDESDQVQSSKKQKKRRRYGSKEPSEDSKTADPKSLSASNTSLMSALTETICILLESVMPLLPREDNDPYKVLLFARFGEIDLIHIMSHFEAIAAENVSQSDEEQLIKRDDCLRTYAAILRCLAQLPKGTVDGIVDFISSSLRSFNEETSSVRFVLSHLVPLSVWGMTDDVAVSLAKSIESVFGDEDSLLSPCSLSLGESVKSRRSTSRKKNNSDKLDLPTFAPEFAWAILNRILQGIDPSSVFLREEILSSEKASACIESSLEQGRIYAEKLFVADVSLGSSYKEAYFEYVLRSCEAYGRFTLHKAAFGGDESAYNSQAKKLLEWTTNKVIPALLVAQPEENELRDLDISRISNASESLDLPASPSTESPPKQRRNLRRTPTRFGRLSSFELGKTVKDTPAGLVSAFIGSLLQSVCILFAEELAIGSSNSADIAESAVCWCRVFYENDSQSLEDEGTIRKGVLSGFIRLAIQLCRSSANFLLLKEIFVRCDESVFGEERTLMKKAVSSLLKGSFGEESKLADGLIDAVFSAADDLLSSELSEFENISSVEDLWTNNNGCLGIVLEEIVSNSKSRLVFAKRLVSSLKVQDDEMTSRGIFEAKCLSVIISNADGDSVDSITGALDVEQFSEGGEMRGVVQKLLSSVSG